jgi:hypothetical protein
VLPLIAGAAGPDPVEGAVVPPDPAAPRE